MPARINYVTSRMKKCSLEYFLKIHQYYFITLRFTTGRDDTSDATLTKSGKENVLAGKSLDEPNLR